MPDDKFDKEDVRFMEAALKQADRAFAKGEVPVGAVIVRGGEIIARGCNNKETRTKATRHAEIEAIEKACKKVENWRLTGCSIYCTLEPCMMCLGAILEARIARVVYGAVDRRMGFLRYFKEHRPPYAYGVECTGGVLADQAAEKLKRFFKLRRGG